MESDKIQENMVYVKTNRLLESVEDVTPMCIELVGRIFECLEEKLFLMPVTLRIMLKFNF